MNILYSLGFILPFIGAILGMSIAYWVRPKTPNGIKLILAFSGAFLLGITIFHLMPEVFSDNEFNAGLWIVGGIILQILLEYLSQGAEHGHTHLKENDLLPKVLFISLCLHAFMEGLPLQQQPELVWGIFIHKIPIGMVLFYLVWNTNNSNGIKITFLLLFAFMSPLGSLAFIQFDFLKIMQLPITALVMGMLLHIATTILFESNQGHAFNIRKLLTILLAFVISYLL
ncbi:MAG: ZIP family metal transporter [Flavobacteriaceae bacterium]|nr:ZIP family metal transporter [Flavobacteriaceae bacterium]MDG1911311.1 ZIP family metal transporter [Flavobacteriaceae bacterium]